MNALVLTPAQATTLRNVAARNGRAIDPRQLDDGTWILNADILDDPFFTDQSGPWTATLRTLSRPAANSKTLEQYDAEDRAARLAKGQPI
jgi:hypothetical protein